jgi:hypothetical protein
MAQNWQHKIHNYSEAPPPSAWMNIANALNFDNNDLPYNLANRLSVFEITPPPSAKENIFELLSNPDDKKTFAERLYDYELAAPASAWPNINGNLNKQETIIIPLKKAGHKNVYFKMAAAAALILLISITVLITRNPGTVETAAVQPQKQATDALASTGAEKKLSATDTQINNEPLPITAEKRNKPVNAKHELDIPANNKIASYLPQDIKTGSEGSSELAGNPSLNKKDKLVTLTGETPQDIDLLNTPNSYINITGPDGQSIRVSAKFTNLIQYLNDTGTQEAIDVIIKESAQWRATFANWREKMTNNMMAPSLINFMDIIELSNVVEGKK